MKGRIQAEFMTLRDTARDVAEKVELIRKDVTLSTEGKNRKIQPLEEKLRDAIKETRKKLARLKAEVWTTVAAQIEVTRSGEVKVDYGKVLYHFTKAMALPEDRRGFAEAWADFKAAAEVLDADMLRGVVDALPTRWPSLAEAQKVILNEVRAALVPSRFDVLPRAKRRAEGLLEMIQFVDDFSQSVERHMPDASALLMIARTASEGYARHYGDSTKEDGGATPERKSLPVLLVELNIPENPFAPVPPPPVGTIVNVAAGE